MSVIQFFLVLSFGLLLSACGKEDNRACSQADFIGTYTGTSACENADTENISIVVSAGPSDTQLSFDLAGSIFIATIDGCSFSGSQNDSNVDIEYFGELNGNEIEVTLKGAIFAIPVDCTSTGKK